MSPRWSPSARVHLAQAKSNQETISAACGRVVESSTPRLDAQLLLMHVLGCDKTLLYAHPEQTLDDAQLAHWQQLLERRTLGEPIAYILGRQAFWDLQLQITKDVLIPRPETELLVECALKKLSSVNLSVLDLGCGSGAISLSLKKERPRWQITGVDISVAAIAVATKNSQALSLTVDWRCGDWFAPVSDQRFDLIISNPPYIAVDDAHLAQGDLRFEPAAALIADHDGLGAYMAICAKARLYLNQGGWLIFEHGCQQAQWLQNQLELENFQQIETLSDLAGHERVTLACANQAERI